MALCAVFPDAITMMISLSQIGKKFNRNWIFKGINFEFTSSNIYAILGKNGAGKSTLLRIIAGMQNPSTGKCIYRINDKEIASDKIFHYLSYCAPGMEIIEEMTLKEFLRFHFSFKPLSHGLTVKKVIERLQFLDVQNRPLHEFSSGMKQRVKLAQAFFSNTPILLLDEPCSNLDETGIKLYQSFLSEFSPNRLVLIASNNEREFPDVKQILHVENFRPKK